MSAGNSRNGRAAKHLDVSNRFIRQAREELAAGDRLQASEKAWGAAAHAVKAAAEQRGWQHNSHVRLFGIVSRIADEAGDPELRDLFSTANSLHQNFYEDWQDEKFVQRGIERVRLLVHKMERYAVSSP